MERAKGKILIFALGGPLFFGVAKAISRQHAVLAGHEVMIVDMTEAATLGVSSSLALEKLILEDLGRSLPVFLVGMNEGVRSRLSKLGLLEKLPPGHVFETRQEALEKAYALVD